MAEYITLSSSLVIIVILIILIILFIFSGTGGAPRWRVKSSRENKFKIGYGISL